MLSLREQKELRALRKRRFRDREGRFLAEGVRLVEDLVLSDLRIVRVLSMSSVEDDSRVAALLDRVRRRRIPWASVPDAEFRRLADTETPQGVLAVAEIPRTGLDDLAVGPPRAADVILVLDAVQDPGNLGTLIRTAEALGARGVVTLEGSVDAWNPKSVRAAMGSSFRRAVVETRWEEARGWFRANGFRIVASTAGAEPVRRATEPTALVVGNEGAGISAAVLADADATVGIPLRGRAESLNVAAAAAILLYELTRNP